MFSLFLELSRRVGVLLEHGKTMEADALVGARVLHDMRIGLLIDLAVGKELEHERPQPKPTPQRSQNDTLVPRQKMHNPLLRSLKKAPTQHRKIEDDSRNSLKKVSSTQFGLAKFPHSPIVHYACRSTEKKMAKTMQQL